jgi:exopolysaccharide production negative regulator
MRIRNTSFAALAAFMLLAPAAIGAEDPPPFASATEAYRQGAAAAKSGHMDAALPALAYAAERGVLGAELKLARIYARGDGVARDDGRAFTYYQRIADEHAEIAPSSPVATFVAEAFVALGQYYRKGVPAIGLKSDPARAAGLYRHAASYFGDADAQYELGRLYLSGDGVHKDARLAANWLAAAAKKQDPEAQAKLGELLWNGDGIRKSPAKGLALITLAHQNAKHSGKEPKWIEDLYREVSAKSDAGIRKEAETIMPAWAGGAAPAIAASMPNDDLAVAGEQLSGTGKPPPPQGMPVGFGTVTQDADPR